MLVQAIQNTINKQTIVIVAHDFKYAEELCCQTYNLAKQMEYNIKYKNKKQLIIDDINIYFQFMSTIKQFILGKDYIVFYAHACHELHY